MPEETRRYLTLCVGDINHKYLLIRSQRRKQTISFSVDPGPNLTVRAPSRTAIREVEEMITQHSEWIQQRMLEIQEQENSHPPREYVTGEEIPYMGNLVPLEVIPALGTQAKCTKVKGQFELHLPISLKPEAARKCGEAAITEWFREDAEKRFAERVSIWKKKLKVEPGELIVTAPKTRWGSCDINNNIRLSWRILMAPIEIIDYIVAHELCHVVHRNHGPRFWKNLAKSMPDCIERRDQLGEIGFSLKL